MNTCQVFYSNLNLPFAVYFKLHFLFELLLFFIGSFFLINFYVKDKFDKDKQVSLIHALCLTLLVFSVYSNDFILWRSFFFPAFLLALVSNSNFLTKFLSTLIWCLTAGSLSFFGVLLGFILSKGKDFYILIIGLLATFFSAQINLLDYPKNAQFVALKLNNIVDFTGLSPKYDFINSTIYSELSIVFLLVTLSSLFLYLLLFLKNNIYKYTSLVIVLFFNLIYLFLHKFIPGVSLLSLSWDLYLILLTSFLFLFRDLIKKPSLYASAAFMPLCLMFAYFNKFHPETNFNCIKNFTNQNTPSSFASSYWQNIEKREYSKIENYELINPVKEVLDKKLKTRWSTRGAQSGGEKFILDFKEQVNLSRIRLNVGPFTSDFPRGLRVEVEDNLGQKTTVFNQSNWIGPIRFTKLGYAYFGPQSDIDVRFDKMYQAKKIILTQIGLDENYDWSIAELELYE